MNIRTLVASALLIVPSFAFGCLYSENDFGVCFNDGDGVDVSIIEYFGVENVNFFKSGQLYTFRSHYDPSVMVTLKNKCLSFMIDTSAKTSTFNFAACVRTELDWLVDAGILSMDRLIREKVELAFSGEGGGKYYWVKQETILPSNITIGSDGVISLPLPDCKELPTVKLPSEALKYSTAIKDRGIVKKSQINHIANQVKTVTVDMHGRIVRSKAAQRAVPGVVLIYNRQHSSAKVISLP